MFVSRDCARVNLKSFRFVQSAQRCQLVDFHSQCVEKDWVKKDVYKLLDQSCQFRFTCKSNEIASNRFAIKAWADLL